VADIAAHRVAGRLKTQMCLPDRRYEYRDTDGPAGRTLCLDIFADQELVQDWKERIHVMINCSWVCRRVLCNRLDVWVLQETRSRRPLAGERREAVREEVIALK